MNFTDMLRAQGIDPHTVIVLRHRPMEAELRKVLPWLAAERPDVFNAYQQTQGDKLERAMKGGGLVASFIGHEAGKALFVGLYSVDGFKQITRKQYESMPANIELMALGAVADDNAREHVGWFDLSLKDFYAAWKGRLIVGWPPPERSWWRRAERNAFPVLAILEDSALDAHMPDWSAIDLSWEQLAVLPTRWKARLSEWRAIYYIYDTSERKGYVGSAYGNTNLLGRWLNYAGRGDGGNTLLRGRDPQNFRFSILQRVSPDMDATDVVRLETTWKERLHTRHPLGLNDN